jgi:tRNA pseudouridine32 synthase/23S rRNA pseudouridine746 synthase
MAADRGTARIETQTKFRSHVPMTSTHPPLSNAGVPASTVHLPQGDWATVLDALCARFPRVAREQWLDRMIRGVVLDADGRPIEPERAYRHGLRVHYFREVPAETPIPFEATLLYCDDHVVIADKPHFLPVMPAGIYVRETLLTRLIERLDNPHLVPLHRIDRATAGLVMLSPNPATRAQYQALFREQRIRKCYEALAPAIDGRIFPLVHRSRIAAAAEFFRMQEIAGAPNSETTIDVLDRNEPNWRYALQPRTGRTHQLRVHLAGLGAGILGDRLYPDLQPRTPDDFTRPLQLLARSLEFVDPRTGARRRFDSERRLHAAGLDAPGPVQSIVAGEQRNA